MALKKANIGSASQNSPTWVWLILCLLIFAVFFRLGFAELDGEEPRRAVVAWEMLQSGNYLVPHLYGLEYYNKPPLHSWILAGFMSLFGSSEFVVRIPGIFSILGIGLILYKWIKAHWGHQEAMLSSLIYLTSADLLLYSTIFSGELDLTFSLFMMINAVGVYRIGKNTSDSTAYFIAYAGLIAAIFTKGWIALPFHILALFFWSLFNGQLKNLFNYRHGLNLLFGILAITIYYWQYSTSGNLSHLLLNNFIESGSKVTAITPVAILNQLIECPVSLFKISAPWTLLLFLYYKKEVRDFIKSQKTLLFSVIYILSNIWIYWIFIDVRDRYLYPFVPFVCVLVVGVIFHRNWWPSKQKIMYGIILTMLALRLLYTSFALPKSTTKATDYNSYQTLVDQLIKKSAGQEIDILVLPETKFLPFSYAGISSIDHPPIIPYQIPYYLIQRTKHAPQYTANPTSGNYYLVLKMQSEILGKGEVVYEFTEAWFDQQVVLWRMN